MNNPFPITAEEWDEIGSIQEIREAWGTEEDEALADNPSIYGVKFKYASDGPGYAGDLFVLHGGALSEDAIVRLIRNREGKIMIAEFD